MIVTIDGPAGTGKSTAARQLAERLGFEFLNTGAMYRAVALVCLQRSIPATDETLVSSVLPQISIRFREARLWLNDHDVSDAIREATVTDAASIVASNRRVREHLVKLQRDCARDADLVTEGRDQGTVVFPQAECKFFLTASAEVRAERRQNELAARGLPVDTRQILEEIQLRDRRDTTRECAPMMPADDAIILDTSTLSQIEVLVQLEQLVRERMR